MTDPGSDSQAQGEDVSQAREGEATAASAAASEGEHSPAASDEASRAPAESAGRKKLDLTVVVSVVLIITIAAQVVWLLSRRPSGDTRPAASDTGSRPGPGRSGLGALPPPTGAPPTGGPRPSGVPPPSGVPALGLRPLDIEEFAAALTLLETAGQPLSADQRSQALTYAQVYAESVARSSEGFRKIFSAITREQREEMFKARPPSGPLATADSMLEELVTQLEKKAGSQAAAANESPPGRLPPPHVILSGLKGLVEAGSLSAEQARTALDELKSIREDVRKQLDAEAKLAALFTQQQRDALLPRSTSLPVGQQATAWLLVKYLQGK